MRKKRGIRRIFRKMANYTTVTLVLVVVLIGSGCIPPRLLEKVMLGIMVKFNTEVVRREGTEAGDAENDRKDIETIEA